MTKKTKAIQKTQSICYIYCVISIIVLKIKEATYFVEEAPEVPEQRYSYPPRPVVPPFPPHPPHSTARD